MTLKEMNILTTKGKNSIFMASLSMGSTSMTPVSVPIEIRSLSDEANIRDIQKTELTTHNLCRLQTRACSK